MNACCILEEYINKGILIKIRHLPRALIGTMAINFYVAAMNERNIEANKIKMQAPNQQNICRWEKSL